jgi:hypothetical protein
MIVLIIPKGKPRQNLNGCSAKEESYFHTLIPRFSRVRTSRFVKFTESPQEQKCHSDPSIDRSVKIIRQLEEVLERYSMMFKELKEKKETASIIIFLPQREERH